MEEEAAADVKQQPPWGSRHLEDSAGAARM
jgi:hypothetical protein